MFKQETKQQCWVGHLPDVVLENLSSQAVKAKTSSDIS